MRRKTETFAKWGDARWGGVLCRAHLHHIAVRERARRKAHFASPRRRRAGSTTTVASTTERSAGGAPLREAGRVLAKTGGGAEIVLEANAVVLAEHSDDRLVLAPHLLEQRDLAPVDKVEARQRLPLAAHNLARHENERLEMRDEGDECGVGDLIEESAARDELGVDREGELRCEVRRHVLKLAEVVLASMGWRKC